jgi:predicted secreted protein
MALAPIAETLTMLSLTPVRPLAGALLLAILLAPGAARGSDEESVYDQVRLEASAADEVETDLLVAHLYRQEQSADQAEAADTVNRAMAAAVEQARAAQVTVRTVRYATSPVYREQRIVGWRVRQDLRLEATDAQRLAALIGDLQSTLSVQSLEHTLSDNAREAAEDGLITRALEAFQRRAARIARTLGRGGYRIVRLDVRTSQRGGPVPRPLMRSAEMAATTVAPPPVEGGRLRVEVRVEGSIELTRDG